MTIGKFLSLVPALALLPACAVYHCPTADQVMVQSALSVPNGRYDPHTTGQLMTADSRETITFRRATITYQNFNRRGPTSNAAIVCEYAIQTPPPGGRPAGPAASNPLRILGDITDATDADRSLGRVDRNDRFERTAASTTLQWIYECPRAGTTAQSPKQCGF